MKENMKHLLYTTLLATLLIAACKPKEKDKPEATASITFTPVHSINHFGNRTNTYYKGDTIRYDVLVSSKEEITNLNVTVNGASKINKSSFSSATGFTERFTYIIDVNPGTNVEIKATVKESTDIETSNSVSFVVSDLKEYRNLKIHNKASIDKADSLSWNFMFAPKSNSYAGFFEEELSNLVILLPNQNHVVGMLWQINESFSPVNTSKAFVKRISIPYENSSTGFTSTVIKATNSYESFSTPNDIINYFDSNPNFNAGTVSGNIQYIDPVAVGDVYILKFDDQSAPSIENYFVFKITDIVDDGKTSDTGGHDNDYIQFDIKYFYSNRF
jgi:hypothetical protein